MNPIGWHLVIRLEDNRVLVPTTRERRILVCVVVEFTARFRIVLYHAPDTHLHLVVICLRDDCGDLARRLTNALRHALALEGTLERARIIPVETQRHAANLPGYVLGNARHHGVGGDPLLEASNLPDLLGYRVIDRSSGLLLHSLLPRLTRTELVSMLGVDDLRPGTDLRHLLESADSAVAAGDLSTRTPLVVAAKAASVRVALDLGATTRQVADLLGLTARRIQMLAAGPADPRLVRAIRIQLGLRERLAVPVGDQQLGQRMR